LSSHNIKYTCIGHCCHDIANEGFTLGGTVSFAALMARALECDVTIITSVGNDFIFENVFADRGIEFNNILSQNTTVFKNIYDENGRTQYLLSKAKNIQTQDLSFSEKYEGIVHIGTICDEVDFDIISNIKANLIGANIQGWLRQTDGQKKVFPKSIDWSQLKGIHVVVLSEEDIYGMENVVDQLILHVEIVVLTKAENGATLFHKGKQENFPSFPVAQKNATGAGDIFTTAFLVFLFYSHDPKLSCIFAHCAASFIVEGHTINNLPTVDMIKKRILYAKEKEIYDL
jgi:sugar/nucleoside kinase (ribokinase family)